MGCSAAKKDVIPVLICCFEHNNELQKEYCFKLRDNFHHEQTIRYEIKSAPDTSFCVKLKIKSKIYDIQKEFNDSDEEMNKALDEMYKKLDEVYPPIINFHNNNRINPNNNNNNSNDNINQRTDIRIREGCPNLESRLIQNNNNNERINIHRNPRTHNLNDNNNFPNYEINSPNNPISFNRHNRARQRIVPFNDINNRLTIRDLFDNMFSNLNINNNNVGANDREILNNLPETQIEDVSKLSQEKKNCVICLEDFKNHDKAIILPCIHLFHKNCIKNWLKKNNTCPICKFKLTESNIE